MTDEGESIKLIGFAMPDNPATRPYRTYLFISHRRKMPIFPAYRSENESTLCTL